MGGDVWGIQGGRGLEQVCNQTKLDFKGAEIFAFHNFHIDSPLVGQMLLKPQFNGGVII